MSAGTSARLAAAASMLLLAACGGHASASAPRPATSTARSSAGPAAGTPAAPSAGAAAAAGAAVSAPDGGWSRFGYDAARSGVDPQPTGIGAASLRSHALPAGPGHWNSPIVAGGRVIVPTGSANDHLTRGAVIVFHLPGR